MSQVGPVDQKGRQAVDASEKVHLEDLLNRYRLNSRAAFRRASAYGRPEHAPIEIQNEIREITNEIERIKQRLRSLGHVTQDSVEDKEIPFRSYKISGKEWNNRKKLLDKVHSDWIEGYLAQSLQEVVRIKLGLQENASFVYNPWKRIKPYMNGVTIPQCATPLEVFDALGLEILVLGGPGSGKTTMLLELAKELIERARTTFDLFMPVYLSLSTWHEAKPMKDWIVAELKDKYKISEEFGELWLDRKQILPILDGLDELNPALHVNCVRAINNFRNICGPISMIVSCRTTDYEEIGHQLNLDRAIEIKPLTEQQVEDYFNNSGGKLQDFYELIKKDDQLLKMMSSPLMLNITTLAYHENEIGDLLQEGTVGDRRRRILETYVSRMFARKGEHPDFDEGKSRKWLSEIAHRMKINNDTYILEHRGWLLSPFAKFLTHDTTWAIICLISGFGLFKFIELNNKRTELTGKLGWYHRIRRKFFDTKESNYIRAKNTMRDFMRYNPKKGVVFLGFTSIIVLTFGWLTAQMAVRKILQLNGVIPWRRGAFFDYATERILLRRVGSNYVFVHKIIMEYFADKRSTK